MIMSKQRYVTLTAAGLLSLAGCGSGSGDETGFLSLGISDGPVHDAQKVCITFDEIEFKKGDGAPFVVALDPAEKVNLLDFQGANAAPILIDQELPAGDYQWMRLGLDAELGSNGGAGDTGGIMCDGEGSYIVMDDQSVYNLYVPSGAETGLKLVSGFTVPVNGSADFTAEFDLNARQLDAYDQRAFRFAGRLEAMSNRRRELALKRPELIFPQAHTGILPPKHTAADVPYDRQKTGVLENGYEAGIHESANGS
jgi:hypothetical protein